MTREQILEDIKLGITSENAAEVYRLNIETLKKRLQQRILEMIDLPIGELDLDIDELMQIAEKYKFDDEISILERYSFETLRGFARSKIQRKKLSQKEKGLEDFLMQDENLARVEQNLTAVGRQVDIESGTLDISAKSGEEDVVVELKMRPYQSARVYPQLMKYMNETSRRVIFVAPEIRRDLFHELESQYNAGRIKFVEVREVEEGRDYEFVEINRENLTKKGRGRIDWTKVPKRNGKPTRVRLFNRGKAVENEPSDNLALTPSFQDSEDANGSQHVDVVFPKKGIPEETYEEYKRNAPGYPKFYNILILYGIIDGDRKKQLARRKTTEVIWKELERLVSSCELDDQLEHYDKTRVASQKAVIAGKADSEGRYFLPADRCSSQDERFLSEANTFENDTRAKFYQMIKIISDHLLYPRNCNYHIDPNGEFDNISEQICPIERDMPNRWKSMDIEQRMKVIEQMGVRFDEVVGSLDKGDSGRRIGGFCRLVNRAAFDRPEEEREFAKESVKFRYARIFSEFLKLKLKRTRQLLRVDRNLAEAYLTYSIPSEHHLDQIVHDHRGQRNVVFNSQLLADFVRRDQEVYREIIGHIDIEERIGLDRLRDKPLFYQIMALHGVPAVVRDRYLAPFMVNPTSSNGSDIPFELIEDFERHMRETRELYELNSRVAHVISCEGVKSAKLDHKLSKLVQRTRLSLLEVINELGEDSERLLHYFNDGEEHSLEEFERERQVFEQKLIRYPSRYSEAISASKISIAQILATCNNGRSLTREIERKSVFFKEFSMFNAFLKIKIARAKDLKTVDETLSQAYLSACYRDYSDIVRSETRREVNPKLFQRLDDGSQGYVMEMDEFFRYVGFEDRVYRSIRDKIVEKHSTDLKSDGHLDGNCNGDGNGHGLNPYERLIKAIGGRSMDHYSRDKGARINAFVSEELTQHPVDLDALRKSFCHARLGTRIIGADDLGVRNFFDDVKLEYLIHGKVPTAQQLNDLYDKDCGGRK